MLDDPQQRRRIDAEPSRDLRHVLDNAPAGHGSSRTAAQAQPGQHVEGAAQHGGKRHVVEVVPLLAASADARKRGFPDTGG